MGLLLHKRWYNKEYHYNSNNINCFSVNSHCVRLYVLFYCKIMNEL